MALTSRKFPSTKQTHFSDMPVSLQSAIAETYNSVVLPTLRQMAHDATHTDMRKSGEAMRAYRNGAPEGAGSGRQGTNRPGYMTPTSANGRDEGGSLAYHDDLMEFLRGRLSSEDLEQAQSLLRHDEESEGEDGETDTPEQWRDSEEIGNGSEGAEPGFASREAQQRRRLDARPGERPGEDEPAPFKGMPHPGGSMDDAEHDMHSMVNRIANAANNSPPGGSRAGRWGARGAGDNARYRKRGRMHGAHDQAPHIPTHFSPPTPGEIAAYNAAKRAKRRPSQLAQDKASAWRAAPSNGFFNRFPDAARIKSAW